RVDRALQVQVRLVGDDPLPGAVGDDQREDAVGGEGQQEHGVGEEDLAGDPEPHRTSTLAWSRAWSMKPPPSRDPPPPDGYLAQRIGSVIDPPTATTVGQPPRISVVVGN